ncbi:ABC transporter permease [Salinispora vitiensis]|uniref:ABC transporter permease n=1 Tax=Salinispora vitiensis TaxID=999544 RepID=UPI00037D8576|nr:ABC transporter permease [Salinispora vitiensis]
MVRMVVAQVRRRLGRAMALFVAVLVATTGFTVLTGSAETSRLTVSGVVEADFRSSYDILVRPGGSRTPLEEQQGLVRPNFLSGQFGGISMSQYEEIRRIPGVEVAAPIAMIGYVTVNGGVSVDLTDAVDPGLDRQVVRLKLSWNTARGLSSLDGDAPRYTYVTRNTIVWPEVSATSETWSDGKNRPPTSSCEGRPSPIEILADGGEHPLCLFSEGDMGPLGNQELRSPLEVVHLRADGSFVTGMRDGAPVVSDRLTKGVGWPLSLLLAAVDPRAEADLVGLDHAVTTGRYLKPDDAPEPLEGAPRISVPVLATTSPALDEGLVVAPGRITGPAVARLPGRDWSDARAELNAAAAVPVGEPTEARVTDAYAPLATPGNEIGSLNHIIQSGAVTYTQSDSGLTPTIAPHNPSIFDDIEHGNLDTSWFGADKKFRPLRKVPSASDEQLVATAVGTFDPQELSGFSEVSAVPLETYFPPAANGADEQSRRLLGGQPLEPDSNPGGYLATPPLLLTTLTGYPGLTSSPAPLSAIRIRVAGVTGPDEVSLERVRSVAQMVATRTGLDVDVTLGSSPAPQSVTLPAGSFGRPQLSLQEQWTKKGVATLILKAIDHKSTFLFGLILIVCLLFLVNGVSAAVRDRRRELGILATLGWPRRRLAFLIVTETGLIAVAAGCVSALIAWPLAQLVGVQLTAGHAALAVPLAIGVSLAAGAVPAWLAARTRPATSIRPAVRPPRRKAWTGRSVLKMALTNVSRTGGRTLLAAAALATGVAAATIVAIVTTSFHGSITGSLLGEAVSIQVRGVDLVAVVATLALGLAAIADVLYLNIRERADEFAVLRSSGWPVTALARLVVFEGTTLGLIGALPGAALGIAGSALFAEQIPPGIGPLLLIVVLAAATLSAVAALVPALLQLRIPMSTLLAEE